MTAYRRTFINFADDDVFLNTGISFPVAFASADISGLDTKLTLPTWRRTSAFVSYALLKGTADLPVVGGLFIGDEALEELEATGTVPITQDQRHTFRAQARYDVMRRLWVAATVRYGSGLPVELEGDVDPDDLEDQYGEDILEQVDLETGRVKPNVTLDIGLGAELWRGTTRRLTAPRRVRQRHRSPQRDQLRRNLLGNSPGRAAQRVGADAIRVLSGEIYNLQFVNLHNCKL